MNFQGSLIFVLLIIIAAFIAGLYIATRSAKKSRPVIHSCLDSFKSMGELLVFKIISKEIVTVEERAFEGMLGQLLPNWVFSKRRIIMIFEFTMNFSYDLRDPSFNIDIDNDGNCLISMPPATCDVALKDLFFYDEQKSKFLPLLIPDILNGTIGRSFNTDEKNRLFSESMEMVRNKAQDLLVKYQEELKSSARNNLEGIARSFGAKKVIMEFSEEEAKIETRMNGEAA